MLHEYSVLESLVVVSSPFPKFHLYSLIGAPKADESLASRVILSLVRILSPEENVKLATGPSDLTSIFLVFA